MTERQYLLLTGCCIGLPWVWGICTGHWAAMCAMLVVGLVVVATAGIATLHDRP